MRWSFNWKALPTVMRRKRRERWLVPGDGAAGSKGKRRILLGRPDGLAVVRNARGDLLLAMVDSLIETDQPMMWRQVRKTVASICCHSSPPKSGDVDLAAGRICDWKQTARRTGERVCRRCGDALSGDVRGAE